MNSTAKANTMKVTLCLSKTCVFHTCIRAYNIFHSESEVLTNKIL